MNTLEATFDVIYSTDLVYGHECWRLCGDAHCCQFARYQIGKIRQVIILLPYEYAYMKKRGYLEQYSNYEHVFREYELDWATIRFEQLSIESGPGECSCIHDIRPTTCRLYPMLPLYELGIGLVGIQPHYALEDELEKVVGLPTTCRVEGLSPSELSRYLKIANAIASEPNCMFHVMAYERARVHVQNALVQRQKDPNSKIAPSPEGIARSVKTLGIELMMGSLFDIQNLKTELNNLARGFVEMYGSNFQGSALEA
jgi:Fe-S-cluster containining protein